MKLLYPAIGAVVAWVVYHVLGGRLDPVTFAFAWAGVNLLALAINRLDDRIGRVELRVGRIDRQARGRPACPLAQQEDK